MPCLVLKPHRRHIVSKYNLIYKWRSWIEYRTTSTGEEIASGLLCTFMQLGKVIVRTWVLNQIQSFLYIYRKMAFEAEMSGKQKTK